jgi:hypothetical protein
MMWMGRTNTGSRRMIYSTVTAVTSKHMALRLIIASKLPLHRRKHDSSFNRDAAVQTISALTSGSATKSRFVNDLNDAIASSPPLAAVTFLSMRAATWYVLVFLLNTDMVDSFIDPFGAEWAVGYLAMRVTGKLRQPLNVAIAAALLKVFPALSSVKASALMGVIKPDPPQRTVGELIRTRPPSAVQQKVQHAIDWLNGPLDKYGFAYYLASKCSIAIVICGTAWAVKHGVDIQAQLSDWGVSQGVQVGAGSMAGATMINLINLPAHLYVLPPALRAVQSAKAKLGLK